MTEEDRARLQELRAQLTPAQERLLEVTGANLDLLTWAADPQAQPSTLKADFQSEREARLGSWGCLLTVYLPVGLMMTAMSHFHVVPMALTAVSLMGPFLLRRRAQIDDHYLIDFDQRRIDLVLRAGKKSDRKPQFRFDELHSLVLCREAHQQNKRTVYHWVVHLVTRRGGSLRWLDFQKNQGGATGVGEKLARQLGIPFLADQAELGFRVKRGPGGVEVVRVPAPSGLWTLAVFVVGVLLMWSAIWALAALVTYFGNGRNLRGNQVSPSPSLSSKAVQRPAAAPPGKGHAHHAPPKGPSKVR